MGDHADLQSRFPYHKSMVLKFKYQKKFTTGLIVLCLLMLLLSYAKMDEYT